MIVVQGLAGGTIVTQGYGPVLTALAFFGGWLGRKRIARLSRPFVSRETLDSVDRDSHDGARRDKLD